MDYGFSKLKLRKIFAETVDGVKSVGLMRKLGMEPEEIQENPADLYVYTIVNHI